MVASFMNVDRICDILLSSNLISTEQKKSVISQESVQRSKLKRIKSIKQNDDLSPDTADYEITPVDIISSMKIKTLDNKEELTEEIIMHAIADNLSIPFKKIDPLELNLDVVTRMIAKPFAIKHLVVPIELIDGELKVAMYNPLNHEALEDIKRVSRVEISPVVSTKTDILKIITEFYGFKSSIVAAEKELVSPLADLGNLEQYMKLKPSHEIESTDQHVKNAVDYLLNYAFEQKASDIHIEPKRESGTCRLRIDGVLHDIYSLPKAVYPAIVSRIKSLSRLNIAEKRRPQDGRMKVAYGGKEAELRVSTVPVAFGEKVVLRVLNPEILFQSLEELGFFPMDLISYNSFLKHTHGIILVTGPTGSGKTTTLYSSLSFLSTPEKNITTVEDPIEMVCPDFNQIAVQPQAGITFASILRNILRQDPDIIMVGEIRDLETAENAIQAALTGHLVLSTLHTNDAVSSITRLIDLGVEPFLINATLVGVIAQRLVRRICPNCMESVVLEQDELKSLGIGLEQEGQIELKRGKGCVQCRKTGYKGRVGIFEMFTITEQVRKLIGKQTTVEDITKVARQEGMSTLRENAIRTMLKGVTTYSEVLRVTSGL
ncbi:MAG: Flp pilus assembly complex ATPase component TadA [Deltaproteobacteria bacterium]|nr:Flp pilus assembly complex ATPase component TadA [Deltaproteobacteria bacterium]